MKHYQTIVRFLIGAGLALALPFYSAAQERQAPAGVQAGGSVSQTQGGPAQGADQTGPPTITYRPPNRSMPGSRIGGGVRGQVEMATGQQIPVDPKLQPGGQAQPPALLVLAPDHVGLTTRPQPVLFWYLSMPTSHKIEFSLNDDKKGKTLVLKDLHVSAGAGIHKLRLADFGVSLSPGTEYSWFVSIVSDPARPASALTAGGSVRYVEAPDALAKKLSAAGNQTATVYAEEGIWYDALTALSEQIEAKQEDRGLRCLRADLFTQVGLAEVAKEECAR